jgi:hypothetical protein
LRIRSAFGSKHVSPVVEKVIRMRSYFGERDIEVMRVHNVSDKEPDVEEVSFVVVTRIEIEYDLVEGVAKIFGVGEDSSGRASRKQKKSNKKAHEFSFSGRRPESRGEVTLE